MVEELFVSYICNELDPDLDVRKFVYNDSPDISDELGFTSESGESENGGPGHPGVNEEFMLAPRSYFPTCLHPYTYTLALQCLSGSPKQADLSIN